MNAVQQIGYHFSNFHDVLRQQRELLCLRHPDLPVLFVGRRVVGDLEEVQVNHFFHLVVVPSALANDHGSVEQEDVSAEGIKATAK